MIGKWNGVRLCNQVQLILIFLICRKKKGVNRLNTVISLQTSLARVADNYLGRDPSHSSSLGVRSTSEKLYWLGKALYEECEGCPLSPMPKFFLVFYYLNLYNKPTFLTKCFSSVMGQICSDCVAYFRNMLLWRRFYPARGNQLLLINIAFWQLAFNTHPWHCLHSCSKQVVQAL